MSCVHDFRPLNAIADSYLMESVQKTLQQSSLTLLKSTLHRYIDNKISFEEALTVFHSEKASTRSLERISSILNVSILPISPLSQLPFVLGSRKKTHPWNEYEDQRLLCAIHKYGLDNWAHVSSFVGNGRTRAQCSQRWFRGLDPRISKVLWSQDEEKRLLQLIDQYGDRAWTKISSELGNRSDAQCRYHYRQMMKEKKTSILPPKDIGHISPAQSAPSIVLHEINPRIHQQQSMTNLHCTKPLLPPIYDIIESINSSFPFPIQKFIVNP